MSSPSTLSPGQLLAGRYEILSTLGKGGMGVVYKAHDRVLNETVAIKVLRDDVAGSPEMAQRFLAEIKLARSVSHRNVCRIHEYGQDGDVRYISMAFVEGVDVKQMLRERGPLPPAEAFDMAIGVAEGLQAIHDEGIIHRDLKAPNLMVDGRGVVRLMDFGIAKQWADSATTGLTATGMIVGTPEYMSPEQVLGKKLDLRSDLYALGIVIYELFTGDTPFHAETPVGLLMKHVHDPPALDVATLPAPLVPVLARALSKDREQRHASAAEMADALREARRGVTGESGPRTAPAPRPSRPPAERTTLVPRPTVALAPPAPPGTTLVAVPPATVAPVGPPTQPSQPAPPVAPRSRALPVAGGVALVAAIAIGTAVLLRGRATPPPQPSPSTAALPSPDTRIPSAPADAPSVAAPANAAGATADPAAAPLPMPRASAPGARREAAVQPQVAQEVEGLLAEAESAFAAQQHKAALEFYEQALKLDPANQRARIGRQLCASALAQAAAAPVRPARAFASGRTEFSGRPAAAAGPAGFESSSGVAVRRVDQAAVAPGKLVFEVEPAAVRAGDTFTVKVYMVNEGAAALRLADAAVATTTDGRTASGSVSLLAREAPPRQRTLIVSTGGQWRAEVESWSLAVTVRTAAGETYRNELAWK